VNDTANQAVNDAVNHKRNLQPSVSFTGPRWVALAFLALGLLALWATFQIRQGGGYSAVGPRVFPLAVAIGLLALSLLFLLRATRFPDRDLAEQAAAEEASTHWLTVGLIVLLLVLYAFALGILGYVVATTLFFALSAWVLRGRAGRLRVLRDLLIGLLLSLLVYLSFTRFLGVRLPAGVLDFLL
jgi:putative tricarboxylic transport membrane protein